MQMTLQELRARIERNEPMHLVEALGSAYYADAHIPGAVNIPPTDVDRLAPELLPDRNALVVVYCSGTCTNSDMTAQRLEELGYTQVVLYDGGKEEWVEHGLPVQREVV